MKEETWNSLKGIGGILFWIYFIIAQGMFIVFFIQICKAWDSTLLIILLGPEVAILKAALWIFFIWSLF